MREVTLPPAGLPPLHRSVVACLAAILELDPAEVPAPAADHPAPWTVWRNWLAQERRGLVPVADPQRFAWPGPWLAVLASGQAGGEVCAVAFGSPPGLAWNPLGGPERFEAVRQGYVIAPADVALWERSPLGASRTAGVVEAIILAPEAEGPAGRAERAAARAGRGLEGDRYFEGRGTFSDRHARGIDLTLVEGEVLEELGIAAEEARRNLVTRGIDLDALTGRRFSVGDVECVGRRLCEPCAHLERLTRPGVLRALVHRGGLRADIAGGGEIRVGDPVRAL